MCSGHVTNMEVIPIIVDQIDRLLSTNCVEAKLNQFLKGIMGAVMFLGSRDIFMIIQA